MNEYYQFFFPYGLIFNIEQKKRAFLCKKKKKSFHSHNFFAFTIGPNIFGCKHPGAVCRRNLIQFSLSLSLFCLEIKTKWVRFFFRSSKNVKKTNIFILIYAKLLEIFFCFFSLLFLLLREGTKNQFKIRQKFRDKFSLNPQYDGPDLFPPNPSPWCSGLQSKAPVVVNDSVRDICFASVLFFFSICQLVCLNQNEFAMKIIELGPLIHALFSAGWCWRICFIHKHFELVLISNFAIWTLWRFRTDDIIGE